MTVKLIRLDPVTESMAPSAYRIQAMVEGVDQVAVAMERKWGVGRLRMLVGDDLRARFDQQKDRLDAAIAVNDERYVAAQAEGMKRAWSALDQAATGARHAKLSPEIWECVLPSTGEVVAILRTDAEANHVAREGRVFTLAEIATLIDGLGPVLEAKRVFPGATVTAIHRKSPMDWSRGDDIPF
jgi:hypothetical protein